MKGNHCGDGHCYLLRCVFLMKGTNGYFEDYVSQMSSIELAHEGPALINGSDEIECFYEPWGF